MDDMILVRLGDWLTQTQLPEGARLPPERSLADQLQVSRGDLRKALQVLEQEGRPRRVVDAAHGSLASRLQHIQL
jgi:DNA-binding GntR family transcriptional regulator